MRVGMALFPLPFPYLYAFQFKRRDPITCSEMALKNHLLQCRISKFSGSTPGFPLKRM